VGRISGAHLNPAVTIGLAAIGQFEWSQVANYVLAQMIGAILGAIVVWLAYIHHFAATEEPGPKLGVFCTGPEIRSLGANFMTEMIGTAMLLFGVLAIAANADEFVGAPGGVDLSVVFATGINPLLVGFLVWGIGLSLGGPTGYAINPARDLGPRIAHAFLPIPNKGDSDWGYALVPVLGPIAGGVLGAFAFRLAFG
jgi:glycerol uptake facilitator protein